MDAKEFGTILLQSRVLKVFAIRKRSTGKLFKDLKTDSKIRISFKIVGDCGASYLDVENLDTGETVHKSQAELRKLLDCFMFNEVEEPNNEQISKHSNKTS